MTSQEQERDRELSYNPQVVQRSEGWFATGIEWSGPWRNEAAARHALTGDFHAANTANGVAQP